MASRSLFPFFGGSAVDRAGGSGDPFLQLRREMDRLFDDAFRGYGPPGPGGSTGIMAPRIDVKESDGELKVCAELPGVSEKDVEVTLDDDVLTIRGEKKAESADERENVHVMERSYGSFARSLRLPYAANPDDVRAAFENGVLTVTLPKPSAQQRSRRIEVKGGASRGGTGRPAAVDRAAAGGKPGASGEAAKETARSPDEGEVAAG